MKAPKRAGAIAAMMDVLLYIKETNTSMLPLIGDAKDEITKLEQSEGKEVEKKEEIGKFERPTHEQLLNTSLEEKEMQLIRWYRWRMRQMAPINEKNYMVDKWGRMWPVGQKLPCRECGQPFDDICDHIPYLDAQVTAQGGLIPEGKSNCQHQIPCIEEGRCLGTCVKKEVVDGSSDQGATIWFDLDF